MGLFKTYSEKEVKRIMPLVEKINSLEEEISKLSDTELTGKYISEAALIDEAGDVIAFSNFLPKGKDDTEVTFSMRDTY